MCQLLQKSVPAYLSLVTLNVCICVNQNAFLNGAAKTILIEAQLAEWSFQTPDVRDSNPVIDKMLYRPCVFTVNC